DEKRKEELAKLLSRAQEAMTKKQYAAAVEFYKVVLGQMPGDETAAKGLTDAQAALAQDQDEMKKTEKFDQHIAPWRAGLKENRPVVAAQEAAAARQITPSSPFPGKLFQQAEAQLDAVRDKDMRVAEFNRLIDLANTAMTGRRFDTAALYFGQALKLVPSDAG